MLRSLRFQIIAPLVVTLALGLVPAAQAANADVCRAAKRGHAAFTDDYRYFVTAFTAERTDDAELGVDLMRHDLRSWRPRVRNTIASTPRGVAARKAVLKLIERSRLAVEMFSDAVRDQRVNERETALDYFMGGQNVLAGATADALPRLQAIGCRGSA